MPSYQGAGYSTEMFKALSDIVIRPIIGKTILEWYVDEDAIHEGDIDDSCIKFRISPIIKGSCAGSGVRGINYPSLSVNIKAGAYVSFILLLTDTSSDYVHNGVHFFCEMKKDIFDTSKFSDDCKILSKNMLELSHSPAKSSKLILDTCVHIAQMLQEETHPLTILALSYLLYQYGERYDGVWEVEMDKILDSYNIIQNDAKLKEAISDFEYQQYISELENAGEVNYSFLNNLLGERVVEEDSVISLDDIILDLGGEVSDWV